MTETDSSLVGKDGSTFETQLIYHISHSKKKNHMNMWIDAEKICHKIQHQFMIKNSVWKTGHV